MCWVQTGFSLELMAAKEDWLEDSPSMDVTRAVLRYLFSSTVLVSCTCSVFHPHFTPLPQRRAFSARVRHFLWGSRPSFACVPYLFAKLAFDPMS